MVLIALVELQSVCTMPGPGRNVAASLFPAAWGVSWRGKHRNLNRLGIGSSARFYIGILIQILENQMDTLNPKPQEAGDEMETWTRLDR